MLPVYAQRRRRCRCSGYRSIVAGSPEPRRTCAGYGRVRPANGRRRVNRCRWPPHLS